MKNKAHGIKIAKWGKYDITKPTPFIKFRDFTSIKKQIHLSSSTHSPFFSCIIHVNVLVKGKKKLLKHSAWLPGSSYYKFYCVSSSINDCFLFLFPFPLIPFSDLSWPELFCWLLWGHLGGHTLRCFILQSLLPTATCKQALTGMDLAENMGKLVLLQHFLGIVSCLPYKLFLGFLCRSNVIKI